MSEETAAPPTGTEPPEKPLRILWKLLTGSAIALGFLLLKIRGLIFIVLSKFKVFFVNPLEGFGIAQLAWTGGSMIVTLFAYALKMGLLFAAGFLLITLIHELGHAVMMRARGLRVSAMVFIPFVGGAVMPKTHPRSVFVDAQIGLAGPLAGAIASITLVVVYHATDELLYLALAFAGFLINLFNLVPIRPLDGGRIAGAISKWMWVAGIGVIAWVMVLWRSPLLLLILILGIVQIWREIHARGPRRFYQITAIERAGVALLYFSLVFLLAFGSAATHELLLAFRVS